MSSISNRLFPQQVRQKVASVEALRNQWYFATALRRELQWRSYSQIQYAKYIETHTDPWGYSSSAFTQQKFTTVAEMLADLGRKFERALEIGCAQGAMTARLAPLCNRLVAVDFVPAALERAQARCQASNISFKRWDLKADPTPGQFDLIVITDVLGSLGGRADIRRASVKLVSALTPGGYLLYGDYVGDGDTRRIQNGWIGRLLLFRPAKILRIIASQPALDQVALRYTERHVLALFQRRAEHLASVSSKRVG